MRLRSQILALAVIMFLAVLGIRDALHSRRTARAIDALASKTEAMQAELKAMERRLQSVQAAVAALAPDIAALRAGSADQETRTTSVDTKPAADASRQSSPLILLSNDAQKMAAYMAAYRGGIEWQYGAIFHAIDATPAQIEQFKDAELALYQTEIDLQVAMHELRFSEPEMEKLWAKQNRDRVTVKERALGALIKPYLEYFRTWDVREYAAPLAYASAFSGEPVTAAQISRTGEILVANSWRHDMNDRAKKGPWASPRDVNWDAARPLVSGVLSPNQVEILDLLFARDAAQRRLSEAKSRLIAQFKRHQP